MTPEQFCYWLQGRAELVAAPLDAAEWEAVKQHLGTVFNKVTPPAPGNGHYISGIGIGTHHGNRTAELRQGDINPLTTATC